MRSLMVVATRIKYCGWVYPNREIYTLLKWTFIFRKIKFSASHDYVLLRVFGFEFDGFIPI